jgi:hypothetical protein
MSDDIEKSFKKWQRNLFIAVIGISLPFLVLMFSIVLRAITRTAKTNTIVLQGEQQVGIVILNENRFTFEGQEAFKTGTAYIHFKDYEHILQDGIDYFIRKER